MEGTQRESSLYLLPPWRGQCRLCLAKCGSRFQLSQEVGWEGSLGRSQCRSLLDGSAKRSRKSRFCLSQGALGLDGKSEWCRETPLGLS